MQHYPVHLPVSLYHPSASATSLLPKENLKENQKTKQKNTHTTKQTDESLSVEAVVCHNESHSEPFSPYIFTISVHCTESRS